MELLADVTKKKTPLRMCDFLTELQIGYLYSLKPVAVPFRNLRRSSVVTSSRMQVEVL
jgi:hypothetical protein